MVLLEKIGTGLVRFLQWLGTLYCVGVMTYFIITISTGAGSSVPQGKALYMEVISGAAIIYVTLVGGLAICLLQKTFFQAGSLILDLVFMGGFVAVAVLLRHSPGQHCGAANTPPAPTFLENATSHASINCKLVKGLFGASVALAVLFAISWFLAVVAFLRTRKERRRGTASDYESRHSNHNNTVPATGGRSPESEKGSEDMVLDQTHNNTRVGRQYHQGTGPTMLAPAVDPALRNVSPMPSQYNSNVNHANTRESTSSAGIEFNPARGTGRHQQGTSGSTMPSLVSGVHQVLGERGQNRAEM